MKRTENVHTESSSAAVKMLCDFGPNPDAICLGSPNHPYLYKVHSTIFYSDLVNF